MLLVLLLKLTENLLGTHPQGHMMRKGHPGAAIYAEEVNHIEILGLHQCFSSADSKRHQSCKARFKKKNPEHIYLLNRSKKNQHWE